MESSGVFSSNLPIKNLSGDTEHSQKGFYAWLYNLLYLAVIVMLGRQLVLHHSLSGHMGI